MKSFLKTLEEKIESVLGKKSSNLPEEPPSREINSQSSNSELEIWLSSVGDQTPETIKDFHESKKYDYLTRKYDSSRETLKKFIQITEEVEKEIEQINPTLKTKVKNKISSGVDKVKSLFKRKPKQLEPNSKKK